MRYILSRASRPILELLAREDTLCAFDFDGTLSPIVDRPADAGIGERTRNLLGRLATLYPCVIVSGRARADLVGRLAGVRVCRAIGNHGAEPEATAARPHAVAEWKAVLDRELGEIPGILVEDKGLSLAVHYRLCARKAEVRRRILSVAQKLPHVRVVGGKLVVNLVMTRSHDKGDALAAERARLGCTWVIFVGDDDNDEDAFALEGNIVPVRIGRKQHSNARYYLRTQAEMDTLLDALVRLRSSPPSP
jgi:trehalose 6-phosphate phosphatase